MELVLLALVLFIGMVVCWLRLPDSPRSSIVHHELDNTTHPTARQPA